MFTLVGYEITEKISSTERMTIYRAKRLSDGQVVVLKVLNSEFPTSHDIARLRQEYEFLKSFNTSSVIKAYDFIKQNNTYLIVLEDFPNSQSLREFIKNKKLDIENILKIAIQLANILEELYLNHVIHKDINPKNILIANYQIKIIDFSLATKLSVEEEKIGSDMPEGTLPYVSPEQTGRMNRTVDYRTDFYSLGVTLYEMLTGSLPFYADDLLGWVHAHIAKKPTPLEELQPDIPKPLANIVLKLLSKAQEQRYQTARILKKDLEHCLKEWQAHHAVANFPLAQNDKSNVLQFSQRLYGRDKEIKVLLEVFAKIIKGEQAVVLISGYSGIGKSTIIKEVQKTFVEKNIFFTAGKFEQLKHDIPYSSQALHPLVRQILSLPKEQMTLWKNKILAALSVNAQIIIDVIPELELIIGPQPPVPELSQLETQTRFEMVFTQFLKVFAHSQHPLVICMDDLQWADIASLEMLKNMLSSRTFKYFLLIGTYRDNEVQPGHMLLETVHELKKAGVNIYHLSLNPLNLEDVNQFIKDTFNSSVDTKELAKLTLEKTGGNPFFIHVLFTYLFQVKALYYDVKQHEWTWDIQQIEKISMTENVIDLLVKGMANFPEKNKDLLKIASCIGNQFDLHLLSHLYQESPRETANNLWPALQEKMIIPVGEEYKLGMVDEDFAASDLILYKFAHDRIQQAAYSQLGELEKQILSLKIGRLKLSGRRVAEINEEDLFVIVNYFSAGINLLTDSKERLEIAKLSLRAAHKAKHAIAYSVAEKYFRQAILLLGNNLWIEQYPLAFEAHKGLVECLYVLERNEEMLAACQQIKNKVTNNFDSASILFIETILYSAQGQFQKVIDTGLEGLKLLGMKVSKNPSKLKTLWLLMKISGKLQGKKIQRILQLPAVQSAEKKLLMDFVLPVFSAMYVSAPALLMYLSLSTLLYSLKHGCGPGTAACLMFYSIFEIAAYRNYKRSLEIGEISTRLVDKFNDPHAKVIVYTILNALVFFYKNPFPEVIKNLSQAYRIGRESGEKIMSYYIMGIVLFFEAFAGYSLTEIINQIKVGYSSLPKVSFEKGGVYNDVHAWIEITEIFAQTLKEGPVVSNFDGYLQRYLDKKIPVSDQNFLQSGISTILIAAYVMEDWSSARTLITRLRADSIFGQVTITPGIREYYFYSALVYLALYSKLSRWKKLIADFWINSYLRTSKKLAALCPPNYEAKYLLLLFARDLVHGHFTKALQYYEKTLTVARHSGFIHIEAIAHEFMGRWLVEQGQGTGAEGYLRRAIYAYQQWGASAKANGLLAKYPSILNQKILSSQDTAISSHVSSSISTGHSDSIRLLDLMAIMKSMQAISSNINLKALLTDLIKTMVEISGAERGILMLIRNEQCFIEAVGHVGVDAPTVLQHQLIDNKTDLCVPIINYVEHTKKTIVLDNASENSAYKENHYIKQHNVLSILCLPVMHQQNLIGILYFENNLVSGAFTQKHIEVSQLLASQAAISLEISQLYEAYNQFVPHQFLDLLGKRSIVEINLGDHLQKNMTILFSDIRGFTTLAEHSTPAEIFQFMNEYLSWMEPIVGEYGGFVDKYIGDSIMALFPNQVEGAIYAAIAMQKKLIQMNVKRTKQNKSVIRMGIGINYGNLMLGTLGGPHRLETSVIGDAVNLASRLENLTKEYNSTVLISDTLYRQLAKPDAFHCRFAGLIRLAGKEQETGVWEIYDADPEELCFAKISVSKWYNEAIEMFNKKDYELALTLFNRCLLILPNDKLIMKYILECKQHLFAEHR